VYAGVAGAGGARQDRSSAGAADGQDEGAVRARIRCLDARRLPPPPPQRSYPPPSHMLAIAPTHMLPIAPSDMLAIAPTDTCYLLVLVTW
jgi:hypothetical protein